MSKKRKSLIVENFPNLGKFNDTTVWPLRNRESNLSRKFCAIYLHLLPLDLRLPLSQGIPEVPEEGSSNQLN